MEVIEIPITVLLEEMMKKLDLLSPKYEAHMNREAKLVDLVRFYPAAHRLISAYQYILLTGSPMDTLDIANNDAAKQAIAYMERNEHKIMKDYSYDELLQKKHAERIHIHETLANNRKTDKIIRKKDEKIKTMTNHWDNFMENVNKTSNMIYQMAEDGYSVGSCELDGDINSTLWEVHKCTEHLNQLIAESTDILQKEGKYPYDTNSDTSETDQFPYHFPGPPPSPS